VALDHGFVVDVADAIVLAVVHERASGQTYNVGEAETPTLVVRLRRIAGLMGWQGRIVAVESSKLPSHLRPPYQAHQDLVMASDSIRSSLGFEERRTEEEGLRETIIWERTHSPAEGDPGAQEYAAEDVVLI
jgi:nucleoside-diphosphate-sugar epimerase